MLTVTVSLFVTLFVAIQDPIIQRFAVRFLGGYLSEKTSADIKVGRIAVTPNLRVFIDDVSVKDLNDNTLARIGKLRTKIYVGDLLDGKIHLSQVELSDTEANLIKYEGTKDFNFKFLVDFFKTDKEKDPDKAKVPLLIDRISLKNIDFLFWNQNKADSTKTARHTMDYAHIDLDNINLEARHFALVGDSVYAVVEMLRAKEISGLELKHFQSDVVVCQKGIFLNDMQMETNNSLFHVDLDMKYNSYKAFKRFVDSVEFDATIHTTDLLLSDIGYFTPVMYKMPNQLRFTGRFSGPIASFSVKDMDVSFGKMTNIKGDLSMHPLNFFNGEHMLNIRSARFSYDDLTNFYIPGKTGTIPLPASLEVLQSGNAKVYFKGSYNNFNSDITFVSDIGNLKASVARNHKVGGENLFTGYIDAQSLDVGALANMKKVLGKLDLTAGFTASFPKGATPDFNLDGQVNNIDLLGNRLNEITLNGDMQENRFKGELAVNDDELRLDFNGLIDFSNAKQPKSDFVAEIHHADLYALNLLKVDTLSQLSTKMYVNLTGFDIDDLEGVLRIDSLHYCDSRGAYLMRSFNGRIVNDNLMQRRINLDCDFFDFEMAGQINFASLMMSLNEYADSFVHFPMWEGNREAFQEYSLKHEVDQDFIASLNLKDTRTLSRLLMPSLEIAKNTSVNATYTSRSRQLNLTARSKSIKVGKVNINDLELRNFNARNAAYGSVSVGEVKWEKLSETDTLAYGLDNLVFFAKMANDTIATRINWDDVSDDDHNKAQIAIWFHPHEAGGTFAIDDAEICVNDTVWKVTPDNRIDFESGRVRLSNLKFFHEDQSVALEGYVPMGEQDTMLLQLDAFNVSLLDIITLNKGFDLDGYITGEARLGNMKGEPMVLADLNIDKLGVNGDNIGDAFLSSQWNNATQSIDVDMDITTNDVKTLTMTGTYYTKRKDNNLDFTVGMDSLRMAIITPFVAGQISRVKGFANGQITVKGSTKQPQLEGVVSVRDGGCKVTYLNTYYTFNPTIRLDSKTIELKGMVLADTLGNKATVEGQIYHDFLKNFRLDLRLIPRDFLVMATTLKNNDTFYGDVIADGIVAVKGPLNDIMLDIKARTRKNTNLVLPLNRVSKVHESDYITFVNRAEETEEEEEQEEEEQMRKNFTINIEANVTDDASVKILLPRDIGTLNATGHGTLKLGTSKTEPLTLIGNYIVKNGEFHLNFKDVLVRKFTLKSGGTIDWTGSPTDGRIDVTGVYKVKTSISTLGLQVDSTASGNSSINVECLIHLKDKLLNPTITFGMNLPNASEDISQTIYSLIDTTNQAVMSTQALSLLILGSFSNVNGDSNGANTIDALANTLLSGFSVSLAKDVDFGVSYHSSYGNSYDELQFALKTEFFENRLIIETNFGVVSDNNAANASNLIGEVDMYYKLFKDEQLMLHFYNHSNYNTNYSSFSFDKLAPYTQGLGLSYSKSFDTFRDLFKRKKTTIVPKRQVVSPSTNGKEKTP